MKIITNHKIINSRSKIAQVITMVSLVFVILTIVFAFNDDLLLYAPITVVVAFLLTQVGTFMGNRWGSKIRPDKAITAALKGLDNKYTLYNYMTKAPHLLVGPAGVFHIITYHQVGTITYDENKKRWKQKGGNAYLKLFAQEGLGRPDLDIEAYTSDLNKYLQKTAPDLYADIKHEPILLFLSEKAVIDAKNAPVPTLKSDKLKDFIRRRAKNEPANMEIIEQLVEKLPKEDIEQPRKSG